MGVLSIKLKINDIRKYDNFYDKFTINFNVRKLPFKYME